MTHHQWWGSGFCRWTIYSWFNPTTSPWIAIVPHILCKVYTHHCGTVARYTNLKVIWALPPNCIKQEVYAHSKRQCAKLQHAAACSIRLWVTHHKWWGSGVCRWTIYSWFNPTTSPWIAIVPHILCKVYTHHCGTVARYTNLKVIWALPPNCIKQGVYAHSKRQCAKLEHAAACSIRLWVTHHKWWGSGFCRWTIYSWFNPTTSPWIAIVPHILCKVYTHHCGTVARYTNLKVIWALPPNCIKQGVYAHSKRQCAMLERAAACSIRLWVTHHQWWGSGFCRWTIYSWFNPTTSPWIAIVPHILCKVYTHHCGTVARYTNLKVIWALPPDCIKQGVYAHSKRQCAKLEHAAACSIRLWVTHHQWWGSGFCRWTIYSWFNPTTSPWIAIVPHILCKVYTHHCGTVARYTNLKVIWALPPNCIKQGVYAHSKRQCAKLEHAAACSIRLWVTHHQWWGSGFCRWTIYSWFNPTTSPWIAIVPHILCKVYTHHCGTVDF